MGMFLSVKKNELFRIEFVVREMDASVLPSIFPDDEYHSFVWVMIIRLTCTLFTARRDVRDDQLGINSFLLHVET